MLKLNKIDFDFKKDIKIIIICIIIGFFIYFRKYRLLYIYA